MRRKRRPSAKESDLLGPQILLQCLDRRVMAARLIADRDRHMGQLRGLGDRRFGRHENRRRRHRIGVAVELAVADRGGDVDRPVAGAADVRAAAALEGLVGADPVAEVVQPAGRRAELVLKLAVEPLGREIPLVARHPLMQAHMRRDDEFGHCSSSRANAPAYTLLPLQRAAVAPGFVFPDSPPLARE